MQQQQQPLFIHFEYVLPMLIEMHNVRTGRERGDCGEAKPPHIVIIMDCTNSATSQYPYNGNP